MPAAWLRHAGIKVRVHDLAVERLPAEALHDVLLVAFSLPMHTATRLALPVIAELRRRLPAVAICAYGLYAPLTAARLREAGATHVFGPECELELIALARTTGESAVPDVAAPARPVRSLMVPDRWGLPALERYAQLVWPDGHASVVGAVEATRGCKHVCRHCPVVPIYQGRFHAVPVDVVLTDVRAQVAAGATHITFADPDFFNGPTHALRLIDALHQEWPALTYDVTIKVEHLRIHDALLPRLRDTGCAFVTSAVESLDDDVLAALDKSHTRADVEAVVARCHELGLVLSPTFVAFSP
ncbi:MAG TPA: radical SAM protein, partial [Vicinamibacterales bacterium]|nr:radical SAM protein [Vicinamibacterales bacterium]